MFDLLEKAGDSHLDEFIQIAGGDGQKFDSFEQGVAFIERFFENPAVEC
jgi:hypothetical protein